VQGQRNCKYNDEAAGSMQRKQADEAWLSCLHQVHTMHWPCRRHQDSAQAIGVGWRRFFGFAEAKAAQILFT